MATFTLLVNGERKEVVVDPSTPLLWVLREELKLTGTKYGCGIGACGACTVHLNGAATRLARVDDRRWCRHDHRGDRRRCDGTRGAGRLGREGRRAVRLAARPSPRLADGEP